jgi:hypothetical protein
MLKTLPQGRPKWCRMDMSVVSDEVLKDDMGFNGSPGDESRMDLVFKQCAVDSGMVTSTSSTTIT